MFELCEESWSAGFWECWGRGCGVVEWQAEKICATLQDPNKSYVCGSAIIVMVWKNTRVKQNPFIAQIRTQQIRGAFTYLPIDRMPFIREGKGVNLAFRAFKVVSLKGWEWRYSWKDDEIIGVALWVDEGGDRIFGEWEGETGGGQFVVCEVDYQPHGRGRMI